jgi:Mrp family chromosome partitioning ATPase
MTRIFEALKKTQPAPAAVPFPQPPAKTGPGPSTPAQLQSVLGRAAAVVARTEPEPAVVEEVLAAPLAADVIRELAALRVSLEAALEERPTRVVLFMSSIGHEGTTTVASQFASLLANDPRVRVLALDLNPRRPALASRFARDAARAHGRGEPPGEQGRLGLMRLGPHSPGAGVAPVAARALVTSVVGSYDWVIVDGPPILDAPEMTDIAPLVDGVVLVVRSGHTKRPVVTRAVDLLRKSGARVIGTVLNRRRLEIPGFLYRRI